MRHRIFIAINLPQDVKRGLVKCQSNWPELPAKWVREDSLHITLAFLGELPDEELPDILRICEDVSKRHRSFNIRLEKICYGPPEKMPPRMVWSEGEKSKELAELKDDLENSLAGNLDYTPDSRSFSPHITLGRINTWEFRKMEPEDCPQVAEEISLSFRVGSIEIMESQLRRGGSIYTILQSFPLSSD